MGKSFPLAAAVRKCSPPSDLIEYAMVDAFTDKAFEGNPAAVVFLPGEKDERWMQQVAAEFNVSQTAFLVRTQISPFQGAGQGDEVRKLNAGGGGHLQAGGKGNTEPNTAEGENEYNIRWFTPTFEVDLCGHATLASSHVLFSTGRVGGDTIVFHCKSGKLIVHRIEAVTAERENEALVKSGYKSTHLLELDFPMTAMTPCDKSDIKSLQMTLKSVEVVSVARTAHDDLIVELSSREDVENLQPQMHELLQCSGRGVHVTAKDANQSSIDFVSRCFFPKLGINEDPVCGSAHCALTPYWAEKLGKESLQAYQASKRGGRLSLRVDFQARRVYLGGQATIVMAGVILK